MTTMKQVRRFWGYARYPEYWTERARVALSWLAVLALYVLITVLDDNTHGFWHQALWDALLLLTGAGLMVMWQQHRRR